MLIYIYISCVFGICSGPARSMLHLPAPTCIILSSEHMECSIIPTAHTRAQSNRKTVTTDTLPPL